MKPILLALSLSGLTSAVGLAADPCPDDLAWLRKECGDGALAYSDDGKIKLVEIADGKVTIVGPGAQPEFSPDSSKLAWIDGQTARGRLRKGDSKVHVIAENVEPKGGVHWLSDTEVAVVLIDGKSRSWRRITLDGRAEPIPELTRMGTGGTECDIKPGKDGVWSYVSNRIWKTSDGKSGPIGGGCSPSLTPDGLAITALQGSHHECHLNRIRDGGYQGKLEWKYDGSFDNHRWSSNDPRFITCTNEKSRRMVIMMPGSTRATHVGTPGIRNQEMYGDFTVGNGRGAPWPTDYRFTLSTSKESEPRSVKMIELKPVKLSGEWPASREALVYLWENAEAANEIFAADGRSTVACRGDLHGFATLGRFGNLELAGGRFDSAEVDDRILEACRRSGQLTVEVVVNSDQLKQAGPARIISFSSGTGSRNFTLGQDKDQLVFRLRTAENDENGTKLQTELGRIESGQWYHVIVTYRDGKFESWINGKQTVSMDKLRGDFGNWEAQHLQFGDEKGGGRDWAGSVEDVAIYSRAIDSSEAEHRHRLIAERLKNRLPVPRLVVEAKLLEMSRTPVPADIAPYRRCLAEGVYEIEKIVEGRTDSKRIAVSQWVILDGEGLPDPRSVGKSFRLTLEPREAHPQLAAERSVSDVSAFDLPAFFEPR